MAQLISSRSANTCIQDPGASHYMSSHKNLFQNYGECNTYIHIAKCTKLTSTGIGHLWLVMKEEPGSPNAIQLQNVLYVPDLGPENMNSVRWLQ